MHYLLKHPIPTQLFKTGTSFDLILDHYIFDRELRLLIMDAVERIEVSIKTKWTYYLSHKYGSHAHLKADIHKDLTNWKHKESIADLKKRVSKSREKFICHFKGRYEEELPPIWAICEIMTLGEVSR